MSTLGVYVVALAAALAFAVVMWTIEPVCGGDFDCQQRHGYDMFGERV